MNPVKKMLAKAGLLDLVWLIDHDGRRTLAIKRKGWCPWAYRYWILKASVRLCPGGTCKGLSFVKTWEDYR